MADAKSPKLVRWTESDRQKEPKYQKSPKQAKYPKSSARRERERLADRELRMTMSLDHFRKCLGSVAFVRLTLDFDVVVKIPMDSVGDRIEVTCPIGFRENASRARNIIQQALQRHREPNVEPESLISPQ